MKKVFISIILITAVIQTGWSQVDRTKPPKAGPAPEIRIGTPVSFELKNGLKVYVVENRKLPRIAFSLTLDRDPIFEGEKAGYVGFAGQLMRNGTTTRNKAQLDEEVDFIGATLSTSSRNIFASSLTRHTDKLLELMTDVLYNPVFPEDELDKLKKQTISNLASERDDPNAIAGNVTDALVYGKDHPYGEMMTEENVEKITVQDCRNYYESYYRPNIAYLAIVGDISAKEAKKLAQKHFGGWESKSIGDLSYDTPQQPEKTYVALVDRSQSVQSVINIRYPINLTPGHPDVVKMRVMNQILGGGFSSRLMQNLREDKAYTYGARSNYSTDKLVGEFGASASVRNEVTDSAVYEFMYELNSIIKEEVTEEEMKAAKAFINGSFARGLESPQTVASFAINTAIYNLPEDYYSTYLKRVEAVTVNDIQTTAEKYIRPGNAHIVIVGKGDEIAGKLERFGEVKYFDIYGESYVPAKKELPEGLTAGAVINSYIEAIGGSKLKDIKDVKIVSSGIFQGQNLEITAIKKAPNKLLSSVKIGGAFEVQKVVYDGENLVQYAQGQKTPTSEQDLEEYKIESAMFPELKYEEFGAQLKLVSLENVDGEDAYVVQVVYPNGKKSDQYYSAGSGLKIREVNYVTTPQGETTQSVDLKDYTETEGVKMPHTIVLSLGPGIKVEAKVTLLEINKGVDDSVFAIE